MIYHILYTNDPNGPWLGDAQAHRTMPDGKPIWEKYRHASDHYPYPWFKSRRPF